jgi:hypothetical protein
MKLTKKVRQKYIDFLEFYKTCVGLSDWKIFLCTDTTDKGDSKAEVESDAYEKTLKIELSHEFPKLTDKEQKNVLFHELVHARVNVTELLIKNHKDIEEEHMVNDIVRGFEELADLEWQK